MYSQEDKPVLLLLFTRASKARVASLSPEIWRSLVCTSIFWNNEPLKLILLTWVWLLKCFWHLMLLETHKRESEAQKKKTNKEEAWKNKAANDSLSNLKGEQTAIFNDYHPFLEYYELGMAELLTQYWCCLMCWWRIKMRWVCTDCICLASFMDPNKTEMQVLGIFLFVFSNISEAVSFCMNS